MYSQSKKKPKFMYHYEERHLIEKADLIKYYEEKLNEKRTELQSLTTVDWYWGELNATVYMCMNAIDQLNRLK